MATAAAAGSDDPNNGDHNPNDNYKSKHLSSNDIPNSSDDSSNESEGEFFVLYG